MAQQLVAKSQVIWQSHRMHSSSMAKTFRFLDMDTHTSMSFNQRLHHLTCDGDAAANQGSCRRRPCDTPPSLRLFYCRFRFLHLPTYFRDFVRKIHLQPARVHFSQKSKILPPPESPPCRHASLVPALLACSSHVLARQFVASIGRFNLGNKE